MVVKLQVSYRATSKAQRIYKFFKPKEIVQGEPFDLELTFTNIGEAFYGGTTTLDFQYPGDRSEQIKKIESPPINENQSHILTLKDLRIDFSGVCGIAFQTQHINRIDKTPRSQTYIYDDEGGSMGFGYALALPVTSKEELYQKYSLVMALSAFFISLTALIIAFIDIAKSVTAN
jgi:hypothetical protein